MWQQFVSILLAWYLLKKVDRWVCWGYGGSQRHFGRGRRLLVTFYLPARSWRFVVWPSLVEEDLKGLAQENGLTLRTWYALCSLLMNRFCAHSGSLRADRHFDWRTFFFFVFVGPPFGLCCWRTRFCVWLTRSALLYCDVIPGHAVKTQPFRLHIAETELMATSSCFGWQGNFCRYVQTCLVVRIRRNRFCALFFLYRNSLPWECLPLSMFYINNFTSN